MPSPIATPASPPPPSFGDDEFSAFDWIQEHSKALTIVLVAGLAIGAAFALWKRSGAIKEDRAERAYFVALRAMQGGNAAAGTTDLNRLITRYAGTAAATQAAMTLATMHYDEGKHTEGVAVLERVQREGVPRQFEASIEALVASGLSDQGKFEEAAGRYRSASEKAVFPADRDAYLAESARSLTSASKPQEALSIWQQLAADPDSPVVPEAKVRIGELTAKPAT